MNEPDGIEVGGPEGEPTAVQEPVPAVPLTGGADGEAVFAALAGGNLGGDEAWPSRPHRSGLRMRVPTLVLLVLVVAAGAFWIGAEVQKSDGTTSAGSSLAGAASRIASLFGRSGTGTGSGFSGLGGTAPAATGTVTAVVGSTLYLTTASGSIVRVQLSKATTIDRDAKASPTSLQSGDSVVVEGTTSSSGVVRASSVAATAKGVSSAGSGLGGFGGIGGLRGAGTGGSSG